MRTISSLFIGVLLLAQAVCALDLVKPGKQMIAGVLVKDLQGALLLLENAGTKQERAFVVRAAGDDAEILETLRSLAVDREPIRLVPEVEMQANEHGLFVPVAIDKPVYAEECYREFLGVVTIEAEFHIMRIVRDADEEHIVPAAPAHPPKVTPIKTERQ